MKVYNQNKTEELTSYDLTKGYLQEDYIIIGKRKSLEETVENEDGSSSTTVYPTLDITETCFVYIPYTEKEMQENEMQALKNWFNDYYTVQEQKLRRLHTIGKSTDDGQDPYQALISLYNLAEVNRARIQELEALIG